MARVNGFLAKETTPPSNQGLTPRDGPIDPSIEGLHGTVQTRGIPSTDHHRPFAEGCNGGVLGKTVREQDTKTRQAIMLTRLRDELVAEGRSARGARTAIHHFQRFLLALQRCSDRGL